MSFTLKDIEGAEIPKKDDEHKAKYGYCSACFNDAVEIQSSVRLRFNREKLAKKMYEYDMEQAVIWGDGGWTIWEELDGSSPIIFMYLDKADAIIAADKEIVEVDNDK